MPGKCLAIYHPLQRWEHKTLKTKNGKALIKFSSPNFTESKDWKLVEFACKQCIGCRLDYSKEWAVRCILEAKQYEHNYFVTLTYATENLPYNYLSYESSGEIILDEDGEPYRIPSLVKEDLKTFMHDLRQAYEKGIKYTEDEKGIKYIKGEEYNRMKYEERKKVKKFDKHKGIRFYACGEYGDENQRPHYHLILFNCPIPDLEKYFITKQYQQIYKSEIIEKIWGKGIVTIGEVTYQSAAYVARYILKKQKGKNKIPMHREEEFTACSTKPGIASAYYEKLKDKMYEYDEIVVPVRAGAMAAMHPPAYFDRLLDKENPEKLREIKDARREKVQTNRDRKQFTTSLSPNEQLKVRERNQQAKANLLKRKMTEI